VIRDNRPQHNILVTEEIVNRDTSTPSPKFVVGRQVIKSDGVYVEGAIQGMKMTFNAVRISKPNKASSSISAIITSLSRVNLPNLMVNTPFLNSVKGCPLALASILDFCKVGLLESVDRR
jgi:hypothetical protein